MSNKRPVYEKADFQLDAYEISLNEALFHNANGYIGVRYDFEEGYPENYKMVPSQYINGFYDIAPMKQAERLYGLVQEKQTMLNVADTQSIKLTVGNDQFSMFTGTVLSSRLWLDLDAGVTVRRVHWRSQRGKELELRITRMASFHQLSLFTIQYEILPLNFSGEILIESGHNGNVSNYIDPEDPRLADEHFRYLLPISCEIKEGASYITSATSRSGLEVCSGVINILSCDHQQEFIIDHHHAVCSFKAQAIQGEKIELVKYAVFCDTLRCGNPKKKAEKELAKALSIPLEVLYQRQEEYLAAYWENCRVEIDDEDECDLCIRYSLFQIIQAVGKDRYSNVAPRGLSGDAYEGHYFWDSEMYIQPFLSITNPELSRTLLEYRYAILEQSREHARFMGHSRGALYAWRTISGRECSGYFPSGSAQYHINGDIAYAIVAYYLATKDGTFLKEMGAEIIWETARLWLDVGDYYQGRFHINNVTGPDEYTCIVNNNYYTNLVAQYNLRWAVKVYELLRPLDGFKVLTRKVGLSEQEIRDFQEAADKMYLPYDAALGINPQDDSFLQKKEWDLSTIPPEKFPLLLHYHPLHLYRNRVCKQADTVMAHYILEDAQSEETMRNSFNYYEAVTTHDSSLSFCIFSIMAARLGMTEKAFAYYDITANLDLHNKHKNTKDGLHIANMGGTYMAIVYGFGGFRLKEQGISIAPVLPAAWRGFNFRICYEDSHIMIQVQADHCRLILERGAAKKITVYGQEYLLEDTLRIGRPQ